MVTKKIKFVTTFSVTIIATLFLIAWLKAISYIDIKTLYRDGWSIGIYNLYDDNGILKTTPCEGVINPIISARDITDIKAKFVADPFVVKKNDMYYMFFEIAHQDDADIALATSKNGIDWEYKQIVLNEPFILSYPCIFKLEDKYYMSPESSKVNSVRLYECVVFPDKWKFVKTLVEGKDFVDPTVFYYNGKWWLFVSTISNENLYLYYADDLKGDWVEHPKSPIVAGNKDEARCGGNIIQFEEKLIRIAQDDAPYYGNSIRAFEILQIDTNEYRETELKESPLLIASGNGWNKDGMHTLSIYTTDKGEYLAAVDGNNVREEYAISMKIPNILVKVIMAIAKK